MPGEDRATNWRHPISTETSSPYHLSGEPHGDTAVSELLRIVFLQRRGMQRPRSLQLTLSSATMPVPSPTALSASATLEVPAVATGTAATSPAVEAMEENEVLTSPAKTEPGSSGDHVRTPTNDITNIALPAPEMRLAAEPADVPTPSPPVPQTIPHPLALLPPQLPPPPQQRPARPSSLLVTPAGQWTPLPSSASASASTSTSASAASTPAAPVVALRQPVTRRPNSLCLPSKWQPAVATTPPTPMMPPQAPLTPTMLSSPSQAQRRPPPTGLAPPGMDVPPMKRLRPSGLLGLAFPPAESMAAATVAATPSSEMPPSPFPPPTPTPSSTSSSTCTAQSPNASIIEDAEMASPTTATDSSSSAANSATPAGFELGISKPFWVPDRDAPLCMQCGARFTVLRRRHHCRACGRVFCSGCAGHTARLTFLGDAKARVCTACYQQLTAPRQTQQPPARPAAPAVAPTSSTRPPAVVVSVLKAMRSGQNSQQPQQQPQQPQRSVVFSDGIRPGGSPSAASPADSASDPPDGLEASWLPPDGRRLPPSDPQTEGLTVEAALRCGRVVSFRICRSVRVSARLLPSLPCCAPAGTSWWLLVSSGLHTVGQSEVFLLLQRHQVAGDGADNETEEPLPPAHAFALVYSVYERAHAGVWVRHLSFLAAPRGLPGGPLLGDRSHAGLLFFRPSRLHCTLHLNLPDCSQPLLCGLLVLRWEAPWAEVFPLRLLLRLGCEHRTYPCPLVSVRGRSPVFGEFGGGRSLVGLLVDGRNFTRGLPSPPGLSVQLRTGCTTVRCPTAAYAAVQKALTAAAATVDGVCRVLAFGAEFCPTADAHLVCHQSLETGEYSTRAISIESRQLTVTAGSFVVFNGGPGFAQNRASIVEDGVLVQLTEDQMARLRDALRSMRPWSAVCSADSSGDLVEFIWTAGEAAGAAADEAAEWFSLIDGRPICSGVRTVPLAVGGGSSGSRECPRGGGPVRWTRLHALREADEADGTPADSLRCASRLAAAVAAALQGEGGVAEAAGGLPGEFAVRVTATPGGRGGGGGGGGGVWEAAGCGGRHLPAGAAQRLEASLRPQLLELGASLASDLTLELVFTCLSQ